ncbi:MAG: CinA family nicotinamide mononucleotide deamidase-related protein [Ignavibacteriae bacterium]|nr:CinA family nicotinamide mononucleotide deamidase-related protein [Ignavibacteriota bacterium]MCB9216343.1 CinA family nicotinamide mononucleotide deamidase-related protein [Ignavibacteria bacterium]
MKIVLISIGDELLSGRTVNTNASWQGRELSNAGHQVVEVLTIGDDRSRIVQNLTEASLRADALFTTGGLGPTDDDKTTAAICELLGCEMVLNKEQQKLIVERFNSVGRQLNERSLKQAYVPEACEVILNRWGTAPGLRFRLNNTPIYVLPGVPFEMRELFNIILRDEIGSADGFHEQVWLIQGLPESVLAERLEPIEGSFSDNLSLAYLPSEGVIRLRLIRYNEREETLGAFDRAAGEIVQRAGEWIVSDRNESLASALARVLVERKATIATAESCTGGLIGGALTEIPGSSRYYPGGIISYANEVKSSALHVNSATIEQFGAVSEETAREMAAGIRLAIPADYGVAVTGIAGPDGGTAEKPVGTVWIAVASSTGIEARLHSFRGERDVIRNYAVNAALGMALKMVRASK